jgi:hypothetical protein
MRKILLGTITIALLCLQGCAAANVQSVARQQAPTYYGRPYEQLSAEEKMHLENHLTRQDTTTWNTGAHVASGVGRLLQGVGVLIFSIR